MSRAVKGDLEAGSDLLIVTCAAGAVVAAVVAVGSTQMPQTRTVVVAVGQWRRPSFAAGRLGAVMRASTSYDCELTILRLISFTFHAYLLIRYRDRTLRLTLLLLLLRRYIC